MRARPAVSVVTLVLVMAGGMLGVAVRAAVTVPIPADAHPLVVPSVTLVINLVGSFLLGCTVGRLDGTRPHLRAFLGTGVLGGFTTYSAFAVQTVQITGAAPLVGLLLAVVAVFGGVAAAVAGLTAGRRSAGRQGQADPPEVAE